MPHYLALIVLIFVCSGAERAYIQPGFSLYTEYRGKHDCRYLRGIRGSDLRGLNRVTFACSYYFDLEMILGQFAHAR